jgi:integrase
MWSSWCEGSSAKAGVAIAGKADLPADHDLFAQPLRHTFATTLAVKGVHPSTAQKMLGQSDIRMTLASYAHTTDGMQDAGTAALEEAFS